MIHIYWCLYRIFDSDENIYFFFTIFSFQFEYHTETVVVSFVRERGETIAIERNNYKKF